MYPKIYSSGQEVAVLSNASNDVLTEKLNAERVYSFSAYQKDLVSEYLVYNNQILADGQFYDIKYVATSQSGAKIEKKVQAEHVSYRLINDVYENYEFTGTPTQILNDLLTGTDFSVGTIDFTDPITFVVNEKSTVLNIILRLVNILGGKLDYSGNGFLVDIKNEIGSNEGFEITIKKNMKSVEAVVDGRGDLKTSYRANYVDMDESEGYTLKGLESANLGDTIRIKNDNIGVDTSNIVIKISRSVIKSKVVNVELANVIDDFTTEFNTLSQKSVNKGSRIYGVETSETDGLVIERYDKLAKTKFNADEWRAQVGDGLGNYTDAIFFDIAEKIYKFVGSVLFSGNVEVQNGTIVVKIDPSGSEVFSVKDGTDVLFLVDDAGNAEFNGKISSAQIDIAEDAKIGNKIILSGLSNEDRRIDFFGGSYTWDGEKWVPSTNPTAYIYYDTSASDFIMLSLGDVLVRSTAGDLDLNAFGDLNLISVTGTINIDDTISVNGDNAVSNETFTTVDGKTVTVKNGIITNVV